MNATTLKIVFTRLNLFINHDEYATIVHKCKMLRNTNSLVIISNFVIFCCCFMHIFLNGYYILHPSWPEIKIRNENLKDIEFPISLKVCVSEISNSYHRYSNLGYKDDFRFFEGKSSFNESLFGWAGHTKDGSTVGQVSGYLVFLII